jgi:hypothetical protein
MNKSDKAGKDTHLPAFLFCNEKMYVKALKIDVRGKFWLKVC